MKKDLAVVLEYIEIDSDRYVSIAKRGKLTYIEEWYKSFLSHIDWKEDTLLIKDPMLAQKILDVFEGKTLIKAQKIDGLKIRYLKNKKKRKII